MKNKLTIPTQEAVKKIRKMYPSGCRVELVFMDDPYSKLAVGERGTVCAVDDTGTVFVCWDCGSCPVLGILYGIDRIRKL